MTLKELDCFKGLFFW